MAELYANWGPKDRILITKIWSRELSKLIANDFFAQRVPWIYSISVLRKKTEAHIGEVAAVAMEGRIGNRFVRSQEPGDLETKL